MGPVSHTPNYDMWAPIRNFSKTRHALSWTNIFTHAPHTTKTNKHDGDVPYAIMPAAWCYTALFTATLISTQRRDDWYAAIWTEHCSSPVIRLNVIGRRRGDSHQT